MTQTSSSSYQQRDIFRLLLLFLKVANVDAAASSLRGLRISDDDYDDGIGNSSRSENAGIAFGIWLGAISIFLFLFYIMMKLFYRYADLTPIINLYRGSRHPQVGIAPENEEEDLHEDDKGQEQEKKEALLKNGSAVEPREFVQNFTEAVA